jgi:phosphopantetheine adenylyltransferase
MRQHGIEKIVKGYRNGTDLEYERVQAKWNLENGGFETELWECTRGMEGISSTEARARLDSGEGLSEILPESVINYILGH